MLHKRTYQNSLIDSSLTWAQFAPEPFSIESIVKVTGAKRQGINYERKTQAYIEMQLANKSEGVKYIRSPWLCYKALGSGSRILFCQPDGLIMEVEQKRCVIVEIKLQHTAEAYWQVRRLYQPVLQFIYPDFTFSALEIVKWLDPHISPKFPESFKFAEDLLHYDPLKFGVHIYNPGR
jgi:hypothetical protein